MPNTDSSPADNPYLITPADTGSLSPPIRAFTVAVAGNVKVTRNNGTVETWPLPAGQFSGSVRLIWATGTTASGFVGLP